MIISMQGNWTVTVKSKSAAFQQRFVVQGAISGNGVHAGTPGTTANVVGTQWSIAIQYKNGANWQTSQTRIKFPQQVGGNYQFDIESNDEGADTDFNDLILTCSTPVNINDFLVYGNVTLYSGNCIFNPCRRFPFVIETYPGFLQALKNPVIYDWIEKNYPERIPRFPDDPNPPDPTPYFKPIVFDLSGEAMQPKTALQYSANVTEDSKADVKSKTDKAKNVVTRDSVLTNLSVNNFSLVRATEVKTSAATAIRANALDVGNIKLAKDIGGLISPCITEAGSGLTLSFEEYDRTAAELAGGPYEGTGNRRLLGDTITDQNGNYIFKFSFDMTFPGLEDSSDIAPGEDVNTVMYPDVIVKIVDYSPYEIRYESAPYYNIPNLKRIDLCLPESKVRITSACFNGNLIGSLGNVFIGGNQNTSGSTSAAATERHGYSNYLESTGIVSVNNSLAGFSIECAAWRGTIDFKGCMYDTSKKVADNKIKWYTMRITRAGSGGWNYVSQNYKHPKFSKRNLPNYIGDDVGPFYPVVGGVLNGSVPAYINIQREIYADGVDWEFSNSDRYMQLNTALYDVVAGVRTPGKFYVRVDGYDAAGALVPNSTDLVALFVHNNGLEFELNEAAFDDPSILNSGCGLFRLTDAQMKTPISFAFRVRDSYGFVNHYTLKMNRCPGTALDLNSNIESTFTISGEHVFPGGSISGNDHQHSCPGYKGTQTDYSTSGLVTVQIQPPAMGDGWIKAGEYFTRYSFDLQARQRVTNGYNTGLSSLYHDWSLIMMERLNP